MYRKVRFSPALVLLGSLGIVSGMSATTRAQQSTLAGTPAASSMRALLFGPPPLTAADLFPFGMAAQRAGRSTLPQMSQGIKLPSKELADAETPDAKSDTPDAKSETPNAKAETPNAKAETPGSKSETPDAKPETPGDKSDAPAAPQAEPQPEPRPQLSPEMVELRDHVRRTTVYYRGQAFNTQSNTAGDVVQLCLAFGVGAEIHAGNTSAKTVNAIGALCWNYPCAGYHLLASDGGQIVPRVGYGYQRHPAQFLAALAMAGVNSDFELRIDPDRGTVADLVRCEQLNCRSGSELSFVLIGLAYYLPDGATWKNDLGQPWSLDRLVKEELDRPADLSSAEAVYRLMGLSCAVNSEKEHGRPLEGELLRASQHVRDLEAHALKLQNSDGTWHPRFFAYQGTSRDTLGVLRSTGHILEWLAMSLDDDRLEDPQVVKAVTQVNNLLVAESSQRYIYALSPRNLETLMHALHALVLYDQRVFQPCDPVESEPEPAGVALYRRRPE